MKFTRYMIIDSNGVLWSDASEDALEKGSALMKAVDDGNVEFYREALGEDFGSLTFVQEVTRTR